MDYEFHSLNQARRVLGAIGFRIVDRYIVPKEMPDNYPIKNGRNVPVASLVGLTNHDRNTTSYRIDFNDGASPEVASYADTIRGTLELFCSKGRFSFKKFGVTLSANL